MKQPARARSFRTLVKHAFRRPATPADLASLMEFYQAGRNEAGTFDDGIEAALQRILADPEFVYRARSGAGSALAAGKSYRISDLALASRLVLLPVEQHSRRRVDRPGRPRQAQGSSGAREAGAAHAGRSEVRSADRTTSPASG